MSSTSGTGALVGRFLSTAGERLTQVGEVLSTLRTAPDKADVVKRLGRDLHTLKGESRLLGLSEIERITHASEDMLFSHQRADKLSEQTEALLYEAIDTIFVCVQARSDGAPIPEADVEEVVKRLRAAVIEDGEGASSKARLRPGAAPTATPAPPEAQLAPPEQHVEPAQAAAADTGAAPDAKGKGGEAASRTMHVSIELLDRVTDLVSNISGALVRNRQYLSEAVEQLDKIKDHVKQGEVQLKAQAHRAAAGEEGARETHLGSAKELAALLGTLTDTLREFREHHFRLDLSFSELTEKVRESRLQALRTIFVTYPPFVRGAARQEGKRIRVEISGDELGVDQRVLDEIAEPCLHLLRNSVAHGIESPDDRRAAGKPEEGCIRINARQDGELVRIEFADDGRGIDVDRVRRRAMAMGVISEEQAERMDDGELAKLVFTPGLSTAATTTELAGRGVGLDVVAAVIDRMGGTVGVETIPGKGTKFILMVPVSLSLTRALLLQASDSVFAIPNAAVVEVFRLSVKEIRNVEGRETTMYRGKLMPLVRLREALGLKGIKDIFVNKVGVVVLRAGDEMAGFVVDNLVGEREIVARPFGAFVGRSFMASGVTLMENGDVVLILHAPDLLRSIHETKARRGSGGAATRSDGSERRILYAEDSIITREYAAGVMRSRGFHVVEASDGQEALELLGKERFDLLLTDLQMPRLDGFKLCAAVRKDARIRNLPIIVMSTLDTPETKRMALDAGADAYLIKSNFAADVLVSTIQQVIR